jgi:hypothetical protein
MICLTHYTSTFDAPTTAAGLIVVILTELILTVVIQSRED